MNHRRAAWTGAVRGAKVAARSGGASRPFIAFIGFFARDAPSFHLPD
jgi:hypothetical protein